MKSRRGGICQVFVNNLTQVEFKSFMTHSATSICLRMEFTPGQPVAHVPHGPAGREKPGATRRVAVVESEVHYPSSEGG